MNALTHTHTLTCLPDAYGTHFFGEFFLLTAFLTFWLKGTNKSHNFSNDFR